MSKVFRRNKSNEAVRGLSSMEYLHIKDCIIIIIQSCRQSTAMTGFSLPPFHENKTENLNTAPPESS